MWISKGKFKAPKVYRYLGYLGLTPFQAYLNKTNFNVINNTLILHLLSWIRNHFSQPIRKLRFFKKKQANKMKPNNYKIYQTKYTTAFWILIGFLLSWKLFRFQKIVILGETFPKNYMQKSCLCKVLYRNCSCNSYL